MRLQAEVRAAVKGTKAPLGCQDARLPTYLAVVPGAVQGFGFHYLYSVKAWRGMGVYTYTFLPVNVACIVLRARGLSKHVKNI